MLEFMPYDPFISAQQPMFVIRPPRFITSLFKLTSIGDGMQGYLTWFNHMLECVPVRRPKTPDEIMEDISKPYCHLLGKELFDDKDFGKDVKISVREINSKPKRMNERAEFFDWLNTIPSTGETLDIVHSLEDLARGF